MSIMTKIMSKFNDNDIIKFSDKNIFKDQQMWVPTGSPTLDLNLWTFGFPSGLSMFAGGSKSGKTTLALHGLKNFQKKYPDGVSIILSSETRDNKNYAKRIGVNTEEVMIIKSKFLEDLFLKLQIVIDEVKLIWVKEKRPGKPKFYVMWDSVGGTLSRAEVKAHRENVETMKNNIAKGKDAETDKDAKMTAFQKESKRLIKSLIAQMYDIDMVFVAIAHTGDKIGGHGGKTVLGGSWNEFFSSIRFELVVIGNEKLDNADVAQYTKIKILKNDFGSKKDTIIEILFGYGVIMSQADIEYGVKKGIIKKEGAKKHSFMGDKLKWSSKREFYQHYAEGNKFLQILLKKLTDEVHKDVLLLQSTGANYKKTSNESIDDETEE